MSESINKLSPSPKIRVLKYGGNGKPSIFNPKINKVQKMNKILLKSSRNGSLKNVKQVNIESPQQKRDQSQSPRKLPKQIFPG